MAEAPPRPRHSYWFKNFQGLVSDQVARDELEAIKTAIRAENPYVGDVVKGSPSGIGRPLLFRFECYFGHGGPEDAATRIFSVNRETGEIVARPHRAGDLQLSPELEARILTFLRTHARTSNAFNIRRHALAGLVRAQAPPSRRTRRTRWTRRTRKACRRSRRH